MKIGNILFGKLGQQIVFNRNLPEAIRSNTNGNYEAYNILQMLSRTLDNVFVVEDNILMSYEQQKLDDSIKLITDFAPKIDYAFILLGVSEQFMSQKLLNIINSGIKWYALCSDPRCLDALTKHITNPPICVFAGAIGLECEIGGKKFITKYLNIEAANVYDEKPFPQSKLIDCKHNKMIVVANQTSTWDRISNVKEMTSLIPMEDVIIYGRCEEQLKDSRFGGEKDIQFIFNSQSLSKVTYVAPIAPGWITAKHLECIVRGVVPLLSKDYATMVPEFINAIKSVDTHLIVETPRDVLSMFRMITENDRYYVETIYKLRKAIYNVYSPIVLRDNMIKLVGG